MTDLNSPNNQPIITTGGFDTHCAWCTSPWDQHEGGKPGEPGGPSTCPPPEWQLDQLYAEALDAFAQACTDDPSYRLTRTGPDSVQAIETVDLGVMLDEDGNQLTGWAKALIRDELHGRALAEVEPVQPTGPIGRAALDALKGATVHAGTHIIDLSTGVDPAAVAELLAWKLVIRRTAVTFALTSGAVSLRSSLL